jgi:hypothetical protein
MINAQCSMEEAGRERALKIEHPVGTGWKLIEH